MKIDISLSDAKVKEKENSDSEEILRKEWQEFLSQVVDSIEQRRRLLKPSAFKPKSPK
jgi:malate synthase